MKRRLWFELLLILIIAILGGLYGRALFLLEEAQTIVIPKAMPAIVETVVYKFFPDTQIQYVYTPFPESFDIAGNATLAQFPLSLEQVLKSSNDAANAHYEYYRQGIDADHNLYWWNVHKSATYWLGKLKESQQD